MPGSKGGVPLSILQEITAQLDDAESEELREAILEKVRAEYGEEAAIEAAEVHSFGCEASPFDSTVRNVLDDIWQIELDAQGDLDFVGTTLGAYRITELIGRGGGGTVYRAERSDDQFERSVALKVLRGETPKLREEVRLHGDLEHDAIARLYDAGRTPDNRSYIVMEFVEGIPLHKYLETASLNDALETFKAVGKAIAFVHARGLLHLDLKPSNILVTADGRPKILDFGIGQRLGPLTKPKGLTDYYASPEQRYGQVVSVTSDVYSLGVLLRDILEEDAPAPLHAIVGRATSYEAGLRYQTADALVADIHAYLRKRPVWAYKDSLSTPASFAYLGRIALERYRFVVLAAVVLIALLATLAVLRNQSSRVSSLREDVVASTKALIDQIDPQAADARQTTRVQLLERQLHIARRQLRDDPPALATNLATLGSSFSNIGYLMRGLKIQEEAMAVANTADLTLEEQAEVRLAYAEGLLENRRIEECDALMREVKSLIDQADNVLLELEHLRVLAELYKASDRLDLAEDVAQEAVRIADLNYAYGDREPIFARDHLASVFRAQGRTVEALELYQRNLDDRRENGQENEIRMAENHNSVAVLLNDIWRKTEPEQRSASDLRLSLEHVSQAILIGRRRAEEGHPILANALHTRGNILQRLGQPEEAVTSYRQSVDTYKRFVGADHPVLPVVYEALAQAQVETGDVFGCIDSYERALSILVGADELKEGATLALYAGLDLRNHGLPESALPFAQHAYEFAARIDHGGGFWQGAASVYGALLNDLERYGEARPYLEAVWNVRSQALGDDDYRKGSSASLLGYALAFTGDERRGLELLEYGYEQLRRTRPRGAEDAMTMEAHRRLQTVRDSLGLW